MKIIKVGEKILTVYDAPIEDDAFEYMVIYDAWIEIYLNKTQESIAVI